MLKRQDLWSVLTHHHNTFLEEGRERRKEDNEEILLSGFSASRPKFEPDSQVWSVVWGEMVPKFYPHSSWNTESRSRNLFTPSDVFVTEEALTKLTLAGHTTTMSIQITLIVGHRKADGWTWSAHKAFILYPLKDAWLHNIYIYIYICTHTYINQYSNSVT